MSFEKLAQVVKTHPEAAAHEKARDAEQRRNVWHRAWLELVYPHWQGPLVKMAHKAGVESAVGGIAHGLPAGAAEGRTTGLPPACLGWLISELITVTASVGVGVQVAYAFAGDENDGTLARIVSLRDGGDPAFLPEHTKIWSGPLAKLAEAAEADVPAAAALFGPLVIDAYDAKVDRLAREEKERKEAERKRIADEQAAKAEAEENRRKLQEAALDESRRLEAEAAAEDAE